MDDSQLIKACKKKDRNAQKKLYEMYASKMMGVCLRYCKNEETARDLLHDGFVQVFTHIGSFTGKGSFEGWLRRIFVNLAIENYRLEKKKSWMITDIEQLESDVSADSGSDYYIGDITQQELLNLIKELPQGYRTIFNLFVFEDMSHREIAESLGINEAASRSQFFRAKALLQKRLNAILKSSNYYKK
ncbi:MAG: sigma-70 family RNA polymerase sigma factor [Petrimonas sp.]|nr:sigma-70 family RNA polymerase sigma factor [Petrimonas sp.]